jgi:hypothetical protein
LGGDRFTAREIHYLFLKLLLSGNVTLLGGEPAYVLLEKCLLSCCRLITMNHELQKDLLEEAEAEGLSCQGGEYEELYDSQCMCCEVTRDDLEFLMKSGYLEGVPEGVVATLVAGNPELRSVFSC